MISKGTISYIKSLQLKKYRNKAQSFLVEGAKSVLELLTARFEVTHVIGTTSFFKDNEHRLTKLNIEAETVSEKQLGAISGLKTNTTVLAVARCLPNEKFDLAADEWCLALDRIRDPGNLGTIIRTADWYGIKKILCTTDCADFYNPKVIQATMGSFTRVQPFYTDLKNYLPGHLVYGAVMDGENVHQVKFGKGGIVLIGNEAQGISDELITCITDRITIPGYGGAESLNAAIATAVICDNVQRSARNA